MSKKVDNKEKVIINTTIETIEKISKLPFTENTPIRIPVNENKAGGDHTHTLSVDPKRYLNLVNAPEPEGEIKVTTNRKGVDTWSAHTPEFIIKGKSPADLLHKIKKEHPNSWEIVHRLDDENLKLNNEDLRHSLGPDIILPERGDELKIKALESFLKVVLGLELLAMISEGNKEAEAKKHTAIAIHAMKQFYRDTIPIQGTLFSDQAVDSFIHGTGLPLNNRPDSFGVVLNQAQKRVFEGIIKAFSDTKYEGHERVNKQDELKARGIKTNSSTAQSIIKGPYGNIEDIPVIKLTQAEILSLSGYDVKAQRQGDKQDVVEAINFLATTQFCFYWSRLKKDEKGNPAKDKKGDFEKEEVMEVGTLFRIKYVKDQERGDLKYYEISPSSVVLDQVNSRYGGNYFLLVPTNWRDEVKQITGKRASSYTYEFLMWLRLKYEEIRRHNDNAAKRTKSKKALKKRPFTLSKSWEEIAIALKMPKSMYRANRKRAAKIIQDAYSVAIQLGYLLKVEPGGATDMLYLNEEYYPKPGKLV